MATGLAGCALKDATLSLECSAVFNRHADEFAAGDRGGGSIPISAGDEYPDRLYAVIHNHGGIGSDRGRGFAEFLLDLGDWRGGVGGGIHDDFSEAIVRARGLSAKKFNLCRIARWLVRSANVLGGGSAHVRTGDEHESESKEHRAERNGA